MRRRVSAVAIGGLCLALGPVASAPAIPLSIASASSGVANDTENTATGFASAFASDALGDANAEISIASGRLSLYASSGEDTPNISPHANALVSGWDRFTITGLPQGTIVDLVVRLEITGHLERAPLPVPYDSNSGAEVIFDVRRADQAVVPTVPGFQAFVSASSPDPADVDTVFTVECRQLAGPFSAFGLSFYGHASANGIATSDFSHTAVLSFGGLPPGATISSDAGFSQQASAPEPSLPWLLAVSGLALLHKSRRPRAG